jgi:predicted transcriptional regulator
MIKAPCENVIWKILPCIRKELVKSLLKKGVSRKEIAKLFGITEAAISQYLKSKRGIKFKINKEVYELIKKSANRIYEKRKKEVVIKELCKICSFICKNS